MRQLPIEQQVLLTLQVAALLMLCVRMWVAKLHRVYLYFFGYVLVELCQALVPMLVPVESLLYRDLYVVSQGLIMMFYALVVFELYSKVLKDLEGLAKLARRYIRIALGLAILIAVLPVRLEKNPAKMTGYLFAFERTVMSLLVIFVLFIILFLAYYPLPLARNVIIYLAGYVVSFLSVTIVTLINNVGYFWNRSLSTAQMGVDLACFLFWLLALSPEGERRRVVVGHQWNPGDDQRVLRQMEAMNAALLRSRPKL
ncbi:MAG: hypothetical protein JOZ32_02330 [Bryobacterales bacterium]|nr:hypothetical protein [Bryobacterales bacterium]